MYHKLIKDDVSRVKQDYMIRWERDLGDSFSLDVWNEAIGHSNISTSCINHLEHMQKLLTRW